MHAARLVVVTLVASVASACGGIRSVVPQQSTLSEVHDRMGRPTEIRFDAAGNELWEYARGPAGEETYLVRATLDGRVIEVTQLLTQAQFAKVVRHVSTKAQVRELLGLPSQEQYFGAEAVWSWRMRESPQRGYFAVRFDRDGVAIETLTLLDASGDDRDRGSRGGR